MRSSHLAFSHLCENHTSRLQEADCTWFKGILFSGMYQSFLSVLCNCSSSSSMKEVVKICWLWISFLINASQGEGSLHRPVCWCCCSRELAPYMLRGLLLCKCGSRTRNIGTILLLIRSADSLSCPWPTDSTYILTRAHKWLTCVWPLRRINFPTVLSGELKDPLCWRPAILTFQRWGWIPVSSPSFMCKLVYN